MNRIEISKVLFWILWPVIVGAFFYGALLSAVSKGIPGRIAMPVFPADRIRPAAIGLPHPGAGETPDAVYGLMVNPGQPPAIGIGDFSTNDPPQAELDVRANVVRIAAREGGKALELALPEDVELLLGDTRIKLLDFIKSTRERATVENVLLRIDEMDTAVSATRTAADAAHGMARTADEHAGQAERLAVQARQRADEAAALGKQGIDAAREVQQLANRAQASGQQAIQLANAAQGNAERATSNAKRALDNTLAVKRYVDLRDSEIRDSLNSHYISNRPGGKALEFRSLD